LTQSIGKRKIKNKTPVKVSSGKEKLRKWGRGGNRGKGSEGKK